MDVVPGPAHGHASVVQVRDAVVRDGVVEARMQQHARSLDQEREGGGAS